MTVSATLFSKPKQLFGLVAWATVTFFAGAMGALASANAAEFYSALTRPAWAPPQWVFGPVWSALYALMAVAAWFVWRLRGFAGARIALLLFVVQLAANALWSWLFFAWHQGALAFADVVALWCLVAATVVTFQRIKAFAAVLLYPYLVWCAFAAALTFSVWRLNPALL